MTTRQKIIFLGVIPLIAASIGAGATYIANVEKREQVIVTGEALNAAQDGQLTIEIVRRNESDKDYSWLIVPGIMFGFAAMMWAGSRP